MDVNVFDWYWDLPIVSRVYFTGCFAVTALCALDVVSVYHLYFNARQIMRGEVWRLVTNFMFFGNWGIDFLFHMYFLLRYCRGLEEGSFRGRSADFLWFLLLGMGLLMCVAPFINIMFFGASLTFMMVYLWSKRNPDMQVSLLGLLNFAAPYLPWVLLGFSFLVGHDVTSDALGIAVGHIYFYAADVWPALAEARGWHHFRKVVHTPWILDYLCGTHRRRRGGGGGGAAAGGGGIAVVAAPEAHPHQD